MTLPLRKGSLAATLAAMLLTTLRAMAEPAPIQNQLIFVTVNPSDGTYSIGALGANGPVLRARVGAKVKGRWLTSRDYPRHTVTQSSTTDVLGGYHAIVMTNTGLEGRPELITT